MFTDNKFRFTLQWGIDSREKHMVGTVLEKLGNKKSEFVVMVLSEYIRTHPEVASPESKINITIQPTQTNAQMMNMVKSMAMAAVEELLAGKAIVPIPAESAPSGPSSEDLAAMLENLEAFN